MNYDVDVSHTLYSESKSFDCMCEHVSLTLASSDWFRRSVAAQVLVRRLADCDKIELFDLVWNRILAQAKKDRVSIKTS